MKSSKRWFHGKYLWIWMFHRESLRSHRFHRLHRVQGVFHALQWRRRYSSQLWSLEVFSWLHNIWGMTPLAGRVDLQQTKFRLHFHITNWLDINDLIDIRNHTFYCWSYIGIERTNKYLFYLIHRKDVECRGYHLLEVGMKSQWTEDCPDTKDTSTMKAPTRGPIPLSGRTRGLPQRKVQRLSKWLLLLLLIL